MACWHRPARRAHHIANGGKASKLMLGPCKNNGDPIRRADAARKMFRKRKNQCETPRNDFAAPVACLTVSWPDEPSGPNNANLL